MNTSHDKRLLELLTENRDYFDSDTFNPYRLYLQLFGTCDIERHVLAWNTIDRTLCDKLYYRYSKSAPQDDTPSSLQEFKEQIVQVATQPDNDSKDTTFAVVHHDTINKIHPKYRLFRDGWIWLHGKTIFLFGHNLLNWFSPNDDEKANADFEYAKSIAVFVEGTLPQPKKAAFQYCHITSFTKEIDSDTMYLPNVENIKESIAKNYNDDLPYGQISDFITSDRSGLMLFYGKPGTGKTSMIKYLIQDHPDHTFYYMPANMLMSASEMELEEFMRLHAKAIYVVEDGELLLKDRTTTVNPIISTLLNFSDGLISASLRSKFLFTFNCPLDQIDPALLRKGRLALKYEFRELSLEKTRLHVPDAKSPMTLSDIYFNDQQNDFTPKPNRTIGFSK